ncbi:MAG: thioredoxin-disulfide reductase [Anaerolineales bacterium]|nr:thioredoxin-disulfide reductase [Anaerolineales bacterium]
MSLQFSLSKAKEPTAEEQVYDVVVIGSGPAGLSAALYASRAQLDTLIVTGHDLGGQVATTWDIDNYPGFPEGISGPDLVELMQKHMERFGATVEMDMVTSVDFSKRPFIINTYSKSFKTRTVITATGASPRKLGVPGEKELTGRGVSYCGTCDGWFFKEKDVAVIGGGDSALEEGLFLTRFANKVTVIHRRDELRAGPALEKRARENEKIDFIWNSVVEKVLGQDSVSGLLLRNVQDNQLTEQPFDGVFVFIGHKPNTQLFQGQLELDELGYIMTDERMKTSVEGVWTAGEAGDPYFRQVIISAGMGAAAAIEAQRWLDSVGEKY